MKPHGEPASENNGDEMDVAFVSSNGRLITTDDITYTGVQTRFWCSILDEIELSGEKRRLLRFHKDVLPDLSIERGRSGSSMWTFSHYISDPTGKRAPAPSMQVFRSRTDDILYPMSFTNGKSVREVLTRSDQDFQAAYLKCWLSGMLALYRSGKACLLRP